MHTADDCFVWTTQQTLAMRLYLVHDQTIAACFDHSSIFVCINTQYFVLGYRTPIVVNHEKEVVDWARKQRFERSDCAPYTIKLLLYGPFGAVCVCVGGWVVALVWCVCICSAARLNTISLGELTGNCWDFWYRNRWPEILNSKLEISNFQLHKKRYSGCSRPEISNFRLGFPAA